MFKIQKIYKSTLLIISVSFFILILFSSDIFSVNQQLSYSKEQCSYQVVNRFPHDSRAFTQGLVYFNEELYEGTGLYGRSSIRKVNLETGKVIQIFKLEPIYFGEGITIWNDKLIQLTWKSRKGFIYDLDSFKRINNFEYSTEGWGLTHDGIHLIMSDGSNALFFLDPDTYEVIKIIYVSENDQPIEKLNELEYIGGEIYANIWQSDLIVRISPQTGQVLSWINLTGLHDSQSSNDAVLNGIAYDSVNDRVLVTGKLWPYIFEIKIICSDYKSSAP